MQDFFNTIADKFTSTFITDDRWMQFLEGLFVTVQITLFAAIIGIALGFLIAIIRSTHDMNLSGKKCRSFGDVILKILNFLCNIYITVLP